MEAVWARIPCALLGQRRHEARNIALLGETGAAAGNGLPPLAAMRAVSKAAACDMLYGNGLFNGLLCAGAPAFCARRWAAGRVPIKWLALDKSISEPDEKQPESPATFTVIVRGVDAATATYLLETYPGSTAEETNC